MRDVRNSASSNTLRRWNGLLANWQPLAGPGWLAVLVSVILLLLAYHPGVPASRPTFSAHAQLVTALDLQSRETLWSQFYRKTQSVLPWSDHILLWTGATGLTLIGLLALVTMGSGFCVRLYAPGSSPPLPRLECSTEPQLTNFRLPILRALPWLRAQGSWEGFESSQIVVKYDDQGQESVLISRRGYADSLTRRIELADCLGLTSVTVELPRLHRDVIFFPGQCGVVDKSEIPTLLGYGDECVAIGEPDGDRVEIREYQQGDPTRYILWKIVARTGGRKLYVRTPEVVGGGNIAIFFWAGSNDDGSAELLRYMLDHVLKPDTWIFGSSESPDVAFARDPALLLLAKSGCHTPGRDICQCFKKFIQQLHCDSIILFIPEDAQKLHSIKTIATVTLKPVFGSVKGATELSSDSKSFFLKEKVSVVALSHA